MTNDVPFKRYYSKTQSISRANTCHNATTFKVDWMVENIASIISQKRKMTFPLNKIILKLCLRDFFFRNYHFGGSP